MYRYQSKLFAFLLMLLTSINYLHADEPITVRALVGSNEVSMGEVFVLQIQVNGSTDVVEPDVSGIKDFSCSLAGKAPNNSVFYSNINGVSKKVVKQSYIINYKLAPLQEGTFTISPIQVMVDNKEYYTKPITIDVRNQQANSDSLLKYKLDRDTYYLGETFPLELVWYFRNNASLTGIEIPAFFDDRFIISKPSKTNADTANARIFEINVGGSRYWGLQSEEVVNGVAYNTLTLKVYLTPKAVGEIILKPASIMSQVVVGYKESSRGSRFPGAFEQFDNFFKNDSFFGGRQPIVKEFAVNTPPTTLDVVALPPGRPDNYTGIVSEVKIADKADTTEVSVGEPINVTFGVTGKDNIYNLHLPDYNLQDNIKGKFKVTSDSSGGKIIGNARIYNLIFRATDNKVSEIPPLELSYFDVEEKEYKTALSNAIPLEVRAARIVTASDIEANTDYSATASKLEKNTASNGILYNYTDESVLVNKSIYFVGWVKDNVIFLAAFPSCYMGLFFFQLFLKRRSRNAVERKSVKAVKEFDRVLKEYQRGGVNSDNLTEALLQYFKVKFKIIDREITLSEIYEKLVTTLDEENLLENFKKIVDYCEACSYSRAGETQLSTEFLVNTRKIVDCIDSKLK